MSILVKVRHFILQKVMIPFTKELREDNPSFSNITINDTICNGMQCVLYLDSHISFLYLLKREEIVK